MEAPLAYWLSVVERLVQARVTGVLDEHGVTRIQWRVMTELSAQPASLIALEQAAYGVAPADAEETVESALAELVDSGWVTGDTSTYMLAIPGTEVLKRMTTTVEVLRASALDGVTPDEEAVMIAALQRIAQNLGDGRD